ncbi:endoglucanase [Colletotrichum graminicola]|uniref:Endoglucanase n=1 Tax=Colletotrichum graminicola (strain M1.001 / M2 / FGSC 10212) TaxID=645133 RepID=E3QZX2_COLGM|nr:endoglucanase [Colletotrichum graminicola M1.001]EFQ36410.1 endoglucanase [Colletotrichum graminicola M1.001]WDK19172.1 endoglucanase [Colletotrichum graminicola]
MYQVFILFSMLASEVLAHVVLENPKPFKFAADGPTNPISSTGDDFPCKMPHAGATYEIDGPPTLMAIGETFEEIFKGQAVHGGGSCQFALSADAKPTKDSKWMVIHSIEGGCPARNQKGNLEGPNKDKYPFTIPNSIIPGDYVFAWIWLARVGGQPKYYMNCAPVIITGMRKKRDDFAGRRKSLARREQFPELFMANMGDVSGGCTTGEALNAQIPIAFPNSGIYVDHPEGKNNLFKQPCDGNPRAGSSVEPPFGGSVTSSTVGTAASSSTTKGSIVSIASSVVAGTTTSSERHPMQPTIPTDTAVSTKFGPAPITTTVTTEVTITVTATIIATSVLTNTTAARPTSTTTLSPSVPEPLPGTCTEGYLICLPDETHFATCTGGKLTGPQPIAPGFKCTAGEGEGLQISPAIMK